MKDRLASFLTSLIIIVGGVALLLAPATAQTPQSSAAKVPSRAAAWPQYRPDGQPDVQGYWATVVYGMGCLSNPHNGPNCVPEEGEGSSGGSGIGPNVKERPKAASRVIDTPDGEVPYLPWARAKQKYLIANYWHPTRQEFIDPQQICLPLGPVRQLTWHDIHLIQYDGYVVFYHAGNHEYQIIPLNGRPHASPKIKLWMGDSRGHWEGTTLVVDVTNQNAKGRLSRSGDFSSDNVHNIVRIHFLNADHARYEAVFDDPTVYARPWTWGMDLERGMFIATGGANGGAGDGVRKKIPANYEDWEEACYEGLKWDVDDALLPGNPINPSVTQK